MVLRATTSNHGNGSSGTLSSRRQATRNVSATTSCAVSLDGVAFSHIT
jgi:hypothetical protein